MSSEEGSAAVGAADVGGRMKELVLSNDQSVSQSVFTITEKAPTRAFFWLKAPTSFHY